MISRLRSLFTPKPTIASAGRALAALRHTRERNRIRDFHNAWLAEKGLPLLPERPES